VVKINFDFKIILIIITNYSHHYYKVTSVVYSKCLSNAMEPAEIAVLLTNLSITEIVKMLLRTLIVMCALVTNESAVSEFNNALRQLPHFLSNETLITTAFPVSATNSEDVWHGMVALFIVLQ